MALNYKPMSAEEDQKRGLLDPGEYTFEVLNAELKRTANGKYDMIVVELAVWVDGKERTMRDWIVLMDEMSWKLRHFANACGLIDAYENGTLEERQFIGKMCCAKVIIKDGTDKKMNSIVDYLESKIAPQSTEAFSDEIPF